MFLPKEGNEMSKSTENSTCQTPFAYDYGFVKGTCIRTSYPKETIRLCGGITLVPGKDSWSRQLWSSNERTGKKTKATSDTYKLYLLNNAWLIQIGYRRGVRGGCFFNGQPDGWGLYYKKSLTYQEGKKKKKGIKKPKYSHTLWDWLSNHFTSVPKANRHNANSLLELRNATH